MSAQDTKVNEVDKTADKAAEKSAEKPMSVSEAMRQPDGKPTPGKVVKDTHLVRVLVSDTMTDSLTRVTYSKESWKEAVPSAWLDGQYKAGKIEIK